MIKSLKLISLSLSILLYTIYQFLPYRVEYIPNTSKVHAYRVNTLTKLTQANIYFNGIELDVYYDNKTNSFDIYHPPVKSIGLSLDKYLSEISNKKLKIWIDFKNLTTSNKEASVRKLIYLIQKYKLNLNLFLIESKNIKELQYIKNKGFSTSYYVPSKLYKSSTFYKDSIYKLIDQYKGQKISFTHQNYKDLLGKFPYKEKYVWALYGNPISSTRLKQIPVTKTILNDSSVKRVLVPFKSIGGNR